MANHIEKISKRYVLATLDSPTQYLISQNDCIKFTDDISRCTKTETRGIANYLKDEFYYRTYMYDIDIVVLPVVVTYEIINECEDGEVF